MRRFLHTRAGLFTKLIPLRDTRVPIQCRHKIATTERGIERRDSPLAVIFIVIACRLRANRRLNQITSPAQP